ncbi:IclR family transcriptional regulator [Micrococcoides hystricis]|uniref:IclR family transcriptional regulator n=1 Tax=Micrococcoides hystricis TaxID=1572761 RepID=A0ABV6PCU3_9MICC
MSNENLTVPDPRRVGVVDKVVIILDALEVGPANLSTLVERTGIPRPTAHRIATSLMGHRLLSKDDLGRYMLGQRLTELSSAVGSDRLMSSADPILQQLRDLTGESAQLFRRQGQFRVCVASVERPVGLRDTIPVGSRLSMKAGSAAQVLLAWEDHQRLVSGLAGAKFTPTALAAVRRRGWAESTAEREAGVASVSAPVFGRNGKVQAAVSISGPIERLTVHPGRLHAEVVIRAANQLTEWLGQNSLPQS